MPAVHARRPTPERRRRARAGRRPTTNAAPSDEPEAVDLPPEPVPDPEPPWPDPGPDPDPEPVPGGPMREPVDPQSTQPLEPVGAIHARRTVSLPRPQTEELGHHTDSWDRPIGTVRVSRGDYQAQPGAPGMPPHRNLGVQKTRRRWLRRFVVLLAHPRPRRGRRLRLHALPALPRQGLRRGRGHDPAGVERAARSATCWPAKGVVESGFFFALRARAGGNRGKLRAGTYTLQQDMTYSDALDALTAGARRRRRRSTSRSPRARRGASWRRASSRPACAAATSSRQRAARRCSTRATTARRKGTTSLEGFLFPATYQLRSRTATATTLVNLQLARSSASSPRSTSSARARKNLSRYDVLIIASMIEREAQVPKDRRADLRGHLQPPAAAASRSASTRRCATPEQLDARPLRESELNIDSAYNTRRRVGPAADADRQPGPGLDPGRGRPGQRQVPLLRRQAVRQRRPRVQLDRRAVPAGRRRLQPRPRQARRQGSLALLMA